MSGVPDARERRNHTGLKRTINRRRPGDVSVSKSNSVIVGTHGVSEKRKKLVFDKKREQRRLRKVADDGRLINGVEIPRGAVVADPSQQVPNNSYSPPPLFYVDKEYDCVDCGRREVWPAQQQKWYYEVAKGSLYATAVRCPECRRSRSERQQGNGDPNPIKHVGSLMKTIRSSIESELLEAGFQLEGWNYGADSTTAWLDYVRPGLILRCLVDPRLARLIAETMDDTTTCQTVVTVNLCNPRSTPALLQRVSEFTLAVKAYAGSLPRTTSLQGGHDTVG